MTWPLNNGEDSNKREITLESFTIPGGRRHIGKSIEVGEHTFLKGEVINYLF